MRFGALGRSGIECSSLWDVLGLDSAGGNHGTKPSLASFAETCPTPTYESFTWTNLFESTENSDILEIAGEASGVLTVAFKDP